MAFIPNPDIPEATTEQVWQQFRLWRKYELEWSDATQVADNPTELKAAWAMYRQALRDAPTEYDDPRNMDLPPRPYGEVVSYSYSWVDAQGQAISEVTSEDEQ
jgi:phage terminase large subunit GpA-like protein